MEDSESEGRKRAIARELEWVRSSPSARRSKSKARLAAFMTTWCNASEQARTETDLRDQIQIPPGPRLGHVVLEVEGLEKDYGDKVLFNQLTFKLPQGGIVGVIGPNGAGKSTLFRLITGQETPDAGTIRLGETVKLAYVDQSRDSLDGSKNVWEEISGGLDVMKVGAREIPSRAYVGSFNFKGGDQQKQVGQLSGGERNRACTWPALAEEAATSSCSTSYQRRWTWRPCRTLEAALEGLPRLRRGDQPEHWFLEPAGDAHSALAFDTKATATWNGSKAAKTYEEDKKRRLGAEDGLIPHRIKFQKFARA